jgi:hypothetical protein
MSGRYTGAIDTGIIGITGEPSNGVAGHPDGLRRAIAVLEVGGNDAEAWTAYANLDTTTTLAIAKNVYGKALNVPRRRK